MNLKLPILFLFICLQHTSLAQYNKLLTEGSEWSVYHFFEASHNYTEHLDGDTIVANTNYQKFINTTYGSPDYPQTALLREDSISKQVIKLTDTNEEQIIYDFSLLPGDTFYVYPGSQQYFMVLDSIRDTLMSTLVSIIPESFTLGMNNPKIFYFTNHDPNFDDDGFVIWVEGIGSLSGLLFNNRSWLGVHNDSQLEVLLCHYDSNGERDFRLIYDLFQNECEGQVFIASNENVNTLQGSINVYPNPAHDFVSIKTEDPSLKIEHISFINSLGMIERISKINSAKFKMNVSKLSKGIFWLVIQLDNGVLVRKKILRV